MARIAGVDIPREKRLEISLTYIYGIGRTTAQQVCDAAERQRRHRVRDLTEEEVARLRNYIDANCKVEGDLRREVAQNIKRKMEIGCYQGVRHRRGPAGARPADAHQRPDPQGTEEDRRRQEEGPQVRWQSPRSPEAAGPASASARTSPTASRTSRARSTTRSSRSPTTRATSSPGRRPATSGSRARASRRRSPPRWRPSSAPGGRWSTACARSTCSCGAPAPAGRPRSARIAERPGIEVTGIKDVTPIPHNGCRPTKRRRV